MESRVRHSEAAVMDVTQEDSEEVITNRRLRRRARRGSEVVPEGDPFDVPELREWVEMLEREEREESGEEE